MFANWTQQKQRQHKGELLHLDIESGSGSTHQVSLLNYIHNGAIETTVEEETRYIEEVTHDNLEDVVSKIFVAQAPSKPIIQNYFSESESITINFNPPEDDGGSPILGYEYSIDETDSYLRNATVNSIISNGVTTKNLKISGLTNGNTYKIRLRAYNSVGGGKYSSVTETPGAKPSQIILSNDNVSIGDMAITLYFATPYDGGFPILGYEYKLNGSLPKTNNYIRLSNGITITGLSNETVYDITVNAYNIIDRGIDSNMVTAQPGILPYAPNILSTSGGDRTITINFEPRYNGGRPILGYEYSFYINGNYQPYQRNNIILGSNSLTITDLTNGDDYTVRIRAYTILGDGADSNSVTVAPGIVPAAPTITSSSIGNKSIIINFDPPYNGGFPIQGYEYSFYTNGNYQPYQRNNIILGSNSLTITDLTNGNEYTVKIRAYSIRGDGLPSGSVTRTPGIVPHAPTIISSSSGDQSITINFTAPYDGGFPIDGYEYSFNTDNHQTYYRPNMPSGNGSLTISPLTNGNTYTIKIRAYNILGGGAASESVTRKAGLVPSAPTNLGALPGDQSVRICFTIPNSGSTPITEYQYSLGGASFTKDNATFGEGNVTITGLSNNLNYSIRLIACNSIGCSEPSTSLEFNLPILNNNGWAIGLGLGSGTKIISDDYGNYYVLANVSSPFVVNSVGTKSGTQLTPSLFGILQFGGACIIKYNRAGDVQWATVVEGISGISIGTDKCGNVVLGGECSDITGFTIRSFNGRSGEIINTPIFADVDLATTISSGPNVVIIKYNTSGSALWSTQLGGVGNDRIHGLDTDPSGNIYITTMGTTHPESPYIIEVFSANLTNPTTTDLYGRVMKGIKSLNATDIFIIKYDMNGLVMWVAECSNNSGDQFPLSLTVDSLGNVFMAAYTVGSNWITFYNAGTVTDKVINISSAQVSYNPLDTTGGLWGTKNRRGLIVKYNTNGQAQWVAGFGESTTVDYLAVTTDNLNNSYLFVKISGIIYIYHAGGSRYATFSGDTPTGNNAVIIKYNSAGVVQWATRIAGTGDDIGYGLATDSNNSLYVIGSFNSALLKISSFYTYTQNTLSISLTDYGNLEASGYDAFLVKYNSSGIAQWATKISGAGNDQGYGITVDGYDRILITGSYTSNPLAINTFGSNSGGTITLNKYADIENSGGTRVFLAKYKADGSIGTTPSKPTNLTTAGGEQSITINFTVPYDGGFPITRYEYSLNGSTYLSTDITIGNGSLTISPLTNGNTYTIKIRAHNTLGGGEESDPVTEKAGLVPSAPTDLGILTGDETVKICFSIPNSGSTPVTDYQYSLNGGTFTNVNAILGDKSIIINLLTNDQDYTISLRVYNSVGWSQPSAPSQFRLPVLSDKGWAMGMGVGTGRAITSDIYGYSYVLANVSAQFVVNNFGTKSGTQITPSLYGTLQHSGACIIKYNREGDVQWATVVEGITGVSIKTDKCGNVIIGGSSSGVLPFTIRSFGGKTQEGLINTPVFATVPIQNITGTVLSGANIILIKYSTNGLALWSTQAGSTIPDILVGLDTDDEGNIYLLDNCLSLSNTNILFEVYDANITNPTTPDLYGVINKSGESQAQCYLIKYNKNGLAQWVTRLGNEHLVLTSNSIVVDPSGNIYITAQTPNGNNNTFYRFVSKNDNVITTTPSLTYNTQIQSFPNTWKVRYNCLVKYNTSGQPIWATGIGENKEGRFVVTTDKLNNVYITGKMNSNPYIFNNTTYYGTFSEASPGGNDVLLIKYNGATGNVLWATRISGAGDDIGYALVTDSTNSVYLTGSFNSTTLQINSIGSVTNYLIGTTLYGELQASGYDAFLIKYNSAGTVQWATKIGGAGNENGYGITVDGYDGILVTGDYTSNPLEINTFDTKVGNSIQLAKYADIQNDGGTRLFVVKYKPTGLIE